VYVTHDQIEALALSTTIAVMKDGNVMQTGRPRAVYENPNCKFVAEFIGTSNFISGVVASRDGDRYTVDSTDGTLRLDSPAEIPVGTDVVVSIRPEAVDISTSPAGGAAPNEWTGTVLTRAFLGDAVDHVVGVGKYEIRVRCNPSVSIEPGTTVYLRMDPAKLTLVPVD
jgi:iron(III) transport system ATP-binding protein